LKPKTLKPWPPEIEKDSKSWKSASIEKTSEGKGYSHCIGRIFPIMLNIKKRRDKYGY